MEPNQVIENDSEKSEKTSTSVEDDIMKLFENELKDYPQVFEFIRKLQELVERQRKLLHKYHERFKQVGTYLPNFIHCSTVPNTHCKLKKNLLIETGRYLGGQGNLGPHIIELDFSPLLKPKYFTVLTHWKILDTTLN